MAITWTALMSSTCFKEVIVHPIRACPKPFSICRKRCFQRAAGVTSIAHGEVDSRAGIPQWPSQAVDVVQALPDPLQALGPVSDAESNVGGTDVFLVYCCCAPAGPASFRRSYSTLARRPLERPRTWRSIAVLIAMLVMTQCRKFLPSQTSEFHKSFPS